MSPVTSFEDELGFIAAAGKAVKGVGKVFKKIGSRIRKRRKKKMAKKKGKVIRLDPQNITGQVPASVLASAANSAGIDAKEIAREIAATIPPAVREQVLAAIREASGNTAKANQSVEAISAQVDDALQPKVKAMLDALQAQQLQTQATYEHQSLLAQQEFRKGTSESLGSISSRLQAIEKRLGSSAVVPAGKITIFGPKNVLE